MPPLAEGGAVCNDPKIPSPLFLYKYTQQMPAKKTYPKKKRAVARRPARKYKKRTNVAEYASLSCVRSLVDANNNTMYNLSNFQLADFPRAVAVARAYQHFRMKSVKLTFKPQYDTYGVTLGGASKPSLYYMIDKAASIPTGTTLEGLKNMGARPRTFDEKPISVTWSPSVLQSTQSLVGDVASAYKVSPWLSTNASPDSAVWNPSQIQHNGIFWWMYTQSVPLVAYSMEVEIQFEFKKPLLDRPTTAILASTLPYAVMDASPDGIEGGSDGLTIPLTAH